MLRPGEYHQPCVPDPVEDPLDLTTLSFDARGEFRLTPPGLVRLCCEGGQRRDGREHGLQAGTGRFVRIRELRELRGITQAELARRMKTSASHLNALENGHRVATLTTIESIARALRVEIAEMFPQTKDARTATPADRVWYRIADRLHGHDANYLRRVEELLEVFERTNGNG